MNLKNFFKRPKEEGVNKSLLWLICDDEVAKELGRWVYSLYFNLDGNGHLISKSLPNEITIAFPIERAKKEFRKLLLGIGVPNDTEIFIEKIPSENNPNGYEYLMQINGNISYFQIYFNSGVYNAHFDLRDAKGNVKTYNFNKKDGSLELIEAKENLNSTFGLLKKYESSAFYCEKSSETERFSVQVHCLPYGSKFSSKIRNIEDSVVDALKNVSSIDSFYKTISELFEGPYYSYSIKFSKKIVEQEKEKWIDTDAVLGGNGEIRLFRITKNGRTIQVNNFDVWTYESEETKFCLNGNKKVSLSLTDVDNVDLSKISEQYAKAKSEVNEVITLRNTLMHSNRARNDE